MSICIHFFQILEVKTEVKFVYTRGQNKGEICILKVKAREIFVYSISSIIMIFLESKQRLFLYICFKSHVQFVYCCLKTMVNFVYSDNARSKQCRILYTYVKPVMKFVYNDIFASYKWFSTQNL